MTSMNSRWETVTGTGHRPQHLSTAEADWARAQLPALLRRLRKHHGTKTIVSGLALGWDTWLAQAALADGFELQVHIPYPQQADAWPAASQALWRFLQEQAAGVICYGNEYDVRLLHARNDGMLDAADAVLALWDESKKQGGTHSTIAKALHRQLPVLHVDPVGQTVDRLKAIPPRWRPPAPQPELPFSQRPHVEQPPTEVAPDVVTPPRRRLRPPAPAQRRLRTPDPNASPTGRDEDMDTAWRHRTPGRPSPAIPHASS